VLPQGGSRRRCFFPSTALKCSGCSLLAASSACVTGSLWLCRWLWLVPPRGRGAGAGVSSILQLESARGHWVLCLACSATATCPQGGRPWGAGLGRVRLGATTTGGRWPQSFFGICPSGRPWARCDYNWRQATPVFFGICPSGRPWARCDCTTAGGRWPSASLGPDQVGGLGLYDTTNWSRWLQFLLGRDRAGGFGPAQCRCWCDVPARF
jgi:hypothetical protein